MGQKNKTLSIKNLSKEFNKELVLNNISIDFPSRGIVFIEGESGCGKSTLLKCISGVLEITKGEIQFNDKKINDFLSFRKNHLSFIFQDYQLIGGITVLENVIIPSLICGGKKEKAINKAISLLKDLGIEEKKNEKICHLSGGQKQRVAICRALMNDSEILLCDEITGALDEKTSLEIMDIIKELSKKKLIIMVTHDLSLEKYADHIISLKRGKSFSLNLNDFAKTKRKENKGHIQFEGISFLTKINLKKGMFRIIISICSLSLTFFFLFIEQSASINAKNYVLKNDNKFLDYNIVYISAIEKKELKDSSFSLTREKLPSKKQISSLIKSKYNNYPSYEGIISRYPTFINGKESISSIEFIPFSTSLINNVSIKGKKVSSFNEVIANKEALSLLKEKELSFSLEKKIEYKFLDERIVDELNLYIDFEIVGEVEEFPFFNTPKIYYSIEKMKDYLSTLILPNLSSFFNENISLYQRLNEFTYEFDDLTSYKRVIKINENKEVKRILNLENKEFSISSSSKTILNEFNLMYDSLIQIVNIFIYICLLISFLLLSLILYSFVISLKKEIGLYKIFGEKTKYIIYSFVLQSIYIILFSYLIGELLKIIFLFFAKIILLQKSGINFFEIILSKNDISYLILFIFLGIISSIIPSSVISKQEIGETIKEE